MAYPEDRTPFLQQPLVTANTDLERLGRPDPTAMGSRMADRVLALPYERQVCQAIHQAGSLVKLHVCGSTTCLLGQMATSGADLFNVDHLVPTRSMLSAGCEIPAATPDEVLRAFCDAPKTFVG
jgi:uroporphyrinogen-III decarboxylase